jgi:hypothetical protein
MAGIREGLLREMRAGGTGVMEATKCARDFVAAVQELSPYAEKDDLEILEYEVEEQLQTGEIDPELLRSTVYNLRNSRNRDDGHSGFPEATGFPPWP